MLVYLRDGGYEEKEDPDSKQICQQGSDQPRHCQTTDQDEIDIRLHRTWVKGDMSGKRPSGYRRLLSTRIVVVDCLLNVPATCKCISGTDLL